MNHMKIITLSIALSVTTKDALNPIQGEGEGTKFRQTIVNHLLYWLSLYMNAEFLSFYLEKNAQVMNNFSWADFTKVVKIDTFHILSKVKTGWKLKIVCQGILYGFNISNN